MNIDKSLWLEFSKDELDLNESEVLSVSISEDSMLSELSVKAKKKSRIIKLPKKSFQGIKIPNNEQ